MRNYIIASLIFGMTAVSLQAEIISIDFNNTASSAWIIDGSERAGPLGTANWNTSSTASGTLSNLVDDSGAATTASINWSSPNTWTSGEGNGDSELALSHAYLDDGPSGANNGPSITVSNIPYANYRVYGLFASGQNVGGSLQMVDFIVNGTSLFGGTTTVYGTVADNRTFNSEAWTEIVSGSVIGNYWTFDGSASTLTVTNGGRDGAARGSITGLVIQQVPEPSTSAIILLAGLCTFCRRKQYCL